MAPSDVLEEVKDLVKKLESRLVNVEARLDGRNPEEQSPLQSMRMVLMGPPGAGMVFLYLGQRVEGPLEVP